MDGTLHAPTAIARFLEGFSLEVTARDAARLIETGEQFSRPSAVFVPWLPNEDDTARIDAAIALRAAGYDPVVHISARRVRSHEALRAFTQTLAEKAEVRRVLLVGGDLASPVGPFETSLSVIESGLLDVAGIQTVGLAGHPEGHPDVGEDALWQALRQKTRSLQDRGMAAEIVTQFSFDATRLLDWLGALRARGLDHPVAIGLPGPASVRTLLRYAGRCGVGTSARVVARYGFSLSNLLGQAGPEAFLRALTDGLDPARTGAVRAHIYPFGGFEETARWLHASL